MKKLFLALSLGGVSVCALADAPRFLQAVAVPDSSATVIVAEGEQEPRSVGSYSIRLYGGANAKAPTDDFQAGIVRPRDGTVESVRFAEFDNDDTQEVVVTVRSAGSGGYQSADVFRIDNDKLTWVKHIDELSKDADAVLELEGKIQSPIKKSSVGAGSGPLQLHHRRVNSKP
ncbi:MAG TPA: PliI family lysozyme inhibitor of I-type lysozyme [Pseudomonadales bacterium]